MKLVLTGSHFVVVFNLQSCQVDLVKDSCHKYFLTVLADHDMQVILYLDTSHTCLNNLTVYFYACIVILIMC